MSEIDLSPEWLKKIASQSKASSSAEDLAWIIPLIIQFRKRWRGKPSEAAKVTGVPRGTVSEWLYTNNYPGRRSHYAFLEACKKSGIEVAK